MVYFWGGFSEEDISEEDISEEDISEGYISEDDTSNAFEGNIEMDISKEKKMEHLLWSLQCDFV